MLKRTFLQKLFIPLSVILILFNAEGAPAQSIEQNTYARFLKTGSEQLKAGNYEAARQSFTEALRYHDKDPAVHLALGLVYFHLRNDNDAERALLRTVELNPGLSAAYQWLGELFYRKDDLEMAASYWEKAVALNPSDAVLKSRFERIRKEHRTEKDFNRDVTSHFLIKYEGRDNIEAGRIVLRVLEEAYGEIGRALSYYPDREIQVILYSSRQFQEVTDAPGWSGGVYDGKIRIPVGGLERETPGLKRLLVHEYTHALVRAMTSRCPVWLNEGLAQFFEGREVEQSQKEALRRMANSGKLPSLSHLEGSFMGLNNNQAQFAYLVSLSAVEYLTKNFGLYRVKSMLEELGSGSDIRRTVDSALSLSYEDFERGWKRALE